jgi:hypothetical protein
MNENKIPTAINYLRDKKYQLGLRSQITPLGTETLEAEALIEFAKLHCEAQLKAILEKVRVREDELNPRNTEKVESTYIGIEFEADKGYEDYCPYKYTVDKDSIINAYDLNNIK